MGPLEREWGVLGRWRVVGGTIREMRGYSGCVEVSGGTCQDRRWGGGC